jgi:flavin-dependent dehydrogenase
MTRSRPIQQVAVLGGGPAGSIAAARLAAAGLRVTLIDERMAWEKPCGGGLTYKAYRDFPFLAENGRPKRPVRDTLLSAPKAGTARVGLTQPMLIYSRRELNQLLLDRAEAAGAQLEKTRVLEATPRSAGWTIRTSAGAMEADHCVVATGARNPLRNVGTEWRAADTMYALGYFLDADQPHVDIQFLPPLEGYIWLFPRCGHLSAGICGKGVPAQRLRRQLEAHLEAKGLAYRGAQFYAHMLPSLERPSWRENRVAGDGWLAVGDSAGFVDPITGEGLYYAMKSGDLAAQVLLEDSPAHEKAATYRARIRQEFVDDLELAALLAQRIFRRGFLFSTVPVRMIEFIRRSPGFAAIMEDLFAGTQNYVTLKRRLLANWRGSVPEMVLNFCFQRLVPETP